jgi:transcriptional regulator with XRE-family HTH domain
MAHSATTQAALDAVAANTRRLRVRADMTQEALAEAVGISTVHLQRIERAAANTRVSTLATIAEVLGVPLGRLFRKPKAPGRPPGRPRSKKPG